MKIWDKGRPVDERIIDFTSSRDRELDKLLAPWDIIGSMAHCVILADAGIIDSSGKEELLAALGRLLGRCEAEGMEPGPGHEDIHSRMEAELIAMTGTAGRKIHAGRSRNDQVLTDISLFLRNRISLIAAELGSLLRAFIARGIEHQAVMMPGYSHLQAAMPSTFGLWFASHAESLCDDLQMMTFAHSMVNASPAGTAAGYGTTLAIDREKLAALLHFERLVISSPYAQLRRGRVENMLASALASAAGSLAAFAGDVCLFLTREFSFLVLDEKFSTGSSIMPQKKNPDVFEIIRARANVLRALPNTLSMLVTNLPSGYNRDYQVIKELIFPAMEELRSLTAMTAYMLEGISVREGIVDEGYNMIFAAEAANRLVKEGIPFRDAYRMVAGEQHALFAETIPADYSHTGSPGNPGFAEISERAAMLGTQFFAMTPSELAKAILQD